MWKFLRGGATVIPGATFIPESRVAVCKFLRLVKNELRFKLQQVMWLLRAFIIFFKASESGLVKRLWTQNLISNGLLMVKAKTHAQEFSIVGKNTNSNGSQVKIKE